MLLWVEPMPSINPVNPKDIMGLTHLVFNQVKFSTLTPFLKQELNERLCIGKVGVDLELCVHAHGHVVDPIMEASCNDNFFLDIISSGICELILGNRGSDHIFSLIPFLRQVKALIFYRSTHLRNLYFDLPSSITLQYLENIKQMCCFL